MTPGTSTSSPRSVHDSAASRSGGNEGCSVLRGYHDLSWAVGSVTSWPAVEGFSSVSTAVRGPPDCAMERLFARGGGTPNRVGGIERTLCGSLLLLERVLR
jgi:hypothetical protein